DQEALSGGDRAGGSRAGRGASRARGRGGLRGLAGRDARLDRRARARRARADPAHDQPARDLRGEARRRRRPARGPPRASLRAEPARPAAGGRMSSIDRRPAGLPSSIHPSGASLADVLERVLDKGVVIAGDVVVQLLDVELLTLKLRLLIASADTARSMGIDWWERD